MALRFRKSVKLAPGVRLNLGKKSAGVSVGGKYGGFSANTRTGVKARVSAPGTGLSYTSSLSSGGGGKSSKRTQYHSGSNAATQDISDWFDADGRLDLWVDAETLSILSLDALERYQEVVRKVLDVEVEKRSDLQYTEKLLAQYKLAVAEYTSRANEIRSSKQQKPTFKEGCVQQKWILLVFAILFCACGVLYCALDRTINFLGLFMTGLGLFSLACFLIGIFASD